MKLTKTKRVHSVVFNITPMIDIVFLLNIFFMTVSQITRVVDQPIPLPIVNAGAQTGSSANVTINVNDQGNIIVSGQKYTLSKTVQILKNRIEESGSTDGLKIELRCDKNCPSEHVNRIIEQLSGIGIEYVRIAVAAEN